MNKKELLEKLASEFSDMKTLASSFDEAAFFLQPTPEKWSVGQNIEHLIGAVKGMAGALKDPSVLSQFGVAERPFLSFDVLKDKYETGLAAQKAKGMPYRHLNTEGVKADVLANFESINDKLLTRAQALNESDFDTLQLPHPLLGVLTLREMLYFTAFHTRHHFDIVEKMANT